MPHDSLTGTLHNDLSETFHSDLSGASHSDLFVPFHSDLFGPFHSDLLGPNVLIFSPEDDREQIKAAIREIDRQQRAGHFTTQRYAIFFKPGIYDDIEINVGFFTQVAGLGLYPTDTRLKKLQCTALWRPGGDKNDGLANFWRAVENLELMEDTLWAVSQASPMRRVKIDKNLYLHENDGYTSGGFLADSVINGFVDHGSQQQWLTRNSSMDSIKTYGWNQVFMGVEFTHAPEGLWPQIPVTTFGTVPQMHEKPFLMYDEAQGYGIFLPAARLDSRGVSWLEGRAGIARGANAGNAGVDGEAAAGAAGTGVDGAGAAVENAGHIAAAAAPGRFIPVADCYIARPEADSAASINKALASGRHLILTPGVYSLDAPIHVSRPDTIILGLGLATLMARRGNACMVTDDVPGIIIAGILFDAGQQMSENLLVVGNRKIGSQTAQKGAASAATAESVSDAADRGRARNAAGAEYISGAAAAESTGNAADRGRTAAERPSNIEAAADRMPAAPTVLCDVFFRVGGFPADAPSRTKNCLEINADHVIGDNLWIWRADHTHQVGWDKNTADHGIIVNGDHVTMYALMVEHFLKYQTIWNGSHGRIYMYQSEMPYDAPCQDAWMSHSHTKNGYASLKVSDTASDFESWCAGIYSYHRDAPVVCHSAAEVPDREDVILHNTFDLHLNGYVGISHVINEAGRAVSENNRSVKILHYQNGRYQGC